MHITSASLIVFTVLMQTAAGLMLASELARLGRSREEVAPVSLCLPVALGLGIFSLGFASTHLASPLAAVFVLSNVFSSALAQEIFFCSVFIGCMALTLLLRIKDSSLESLFGKISALAGLVAIGSIANVYIQDTIPTFNTSGTLFSFVGTGCMVGGVLGSLLYGLGLRKSPEPDETKLPAKAFLAMALLGLGLEFLASPLNMIAKSYAGAYGATGVETMLANATESCLPYSIVLIIAGLLACLLGWLCSMKRKTAAPLVTGSGIGFACVLVGSLALRYFFYESYIRLGL
jgi:DMSO reductase anchor subunit